MGRKDSSTTKLPVDQYRKQIGKQRAFVNINTKKNYVYQLRNTFSVIYTAHKNIRIKNHLVGF